MNGHTQVPRFQQHISCLCHSPDSLESTPTSAPSSTRLRSGASSGHQTPAEAAVGKGFLTKGSISKSTNPLEQFERSPACSSTLPALESLGGHPGAGTASLAPLAMRTADCPLSSLQTPTVGQTAGKNKPAQPRLTWDTVLPPQINNFCRKHLSRAGKKGLRSWL